MVFAGFGLPTECQCPLFVQNFFHGRNQFLFLIHSIAAIPPTSMLATDDALIALNAFIGKCQSSLCNTIPG